MFGTRQWEEELEGFTGLPEKSCNPAPKRQEKTLGDLPRVHAVARQTLGQGLACTLMSSTSNTKAA